MSTKGYAIFNSVFIALIVGIFVYSFFIQSDTETIKCVHKQYLGINCPSCGLTRSFSDILHQNIPAARENNIFGLRLFLFFSIQLSLRIVFLLIVHFFSGIIKIIVKIDWIISSVLFLICFYPFIFSTFNLFYKILITSN